MFAFYARKNTIVPVIVGFVGYGLYAVVALPFYQTIGMPALAFANTMQNSMHAIILLIAFYKFFGSLNLLKILPTLFKIILSAIMMALAIWGTLFLMSLSPMFSLVTFNGQFLTVLVAGIVATVTYFGSILLLRVEEIALLKQAILAKLGRK